MGPPATQPPPLPEENGLLAEGAQEGLPPAAQASPVGRRRLIAASLLLAAVLAGAGGGALTRLHAASATGSPLEVTALGESRPERRLKARDEREAKMKLLDDQLAEAKQKLAKARADSEKQTEEMEDRLAEEEEAFKAVEEEQGAVIADAREERDAALKEARMGLTYAEERRDAIQADAEVEREDAVGGAKEKSETAIREKAATLARTKDALAAKKKAEEQIEKLEEKAFVAEEAVKRFGKMVKGESYTEPSDEDEEGDQAVPRSLYKYR